MLYRKVRIYRDQMTVITKFVPSHEIIALQVAFGNESIRVEKGYEITSVPYLPELLERERLEKVYGYEVAFEAYGSAAETGRVDKLIPPWARYVSKALNAVTPKPVRGIARIPEPFTPTPEFKGEYEMRTRGALHAVREALKDVTRDP